jgi:hypothetical protein
MTMEIAAEYQGIDTDQGIWQYFQRHWKDFSGNGESLRVCAPSSQLDFDIQLG